MINKTITTVVLLLFLVFHTEAQTPLSEHTLQLDDPTNSPSASVEQMAWLEGFWQGEGMGGVVEEVWSPPTAGSLMGVFRFIREDAVSFYEIVTLTEEHGSLMLRLKHFHPDLKGWEEQEETVDFPLVKIDQDTAWFNGFTIQRISEDKMDIYVLVGTEDGTNDEVLFSYRRTN